MEMADFEQLVKCHASVVRSIVYHILRSPDDVEDVTQDVFIKVYESLSTFRGGNVHAYIARIARNHCYDVLRRRRAKPMWRFMEDVEDHEVVSTAPSPEDRLLAQEMSMEIDGILNQMNAVDRDILVMKHVHGFSHEDIALAMEMREGAVRTRLSRARKRFIALMGRGENGEASFMG